MVKKDNQEHISSLKAQGLDLIRSNRLEEAKTLYARICDSNAEDVDAWYMLSCIYGMMGNIDEAGNCCRRVLSLQPNHGDAHLNLGNVLLHYGKHDEAISHYKTALQFNPKNAGALCCLGTSLAAVGNHDEAVANFEAAIRLNPNIVEAYYNLGNSQIAQNKYEAAVESYRQAIRLNPRYALAYNNLGSALKKLGAIDLAKENYRHAISINPNLATAYNNLSITLKEERDLKTAEEMAQRALQIQADFVDAHINLSGIRIDQGQPKPAIAHLQEVMRISPDRSDVYSSLISTMRYLPDYSPQDLLDVAKNWATRYAPHEQHIIPPTNLPDPQRRLRVGYVSGDFYNHPVGRFIELVLAHHDRAQYEVYCYHNSLKQDELTSCLQKSADHWLNIADKSDLELAQQIRLDGIDILIDLAGHTKANRLLTFAQKPAPVQATWLGDPASTGLPAMDYIIADRIAIPPHEERYHVEQVVRLPNAYECFKPPGYPIEPGPLPALTTGKLTLGSFNNPVKITDAVIACWSRLLHALPESQLYLKYKPFDDIGVQKRYLGLFANHGIMADRIKFSGYAPNIEFLSAYSEVDIGLDTFPYNGGFTTLEALWMGVPVVSLRENRFVGRMGETLLTNIGLKECVVDSEDDYIAKTTALASDLPRLAELRSCLRAQLLNSPICDGPGFTRDLEAAYRTMWETWCRTQAQTNA